LHVDDDLGVKGCGGAALKEFSKIFHLIIKMELQLSIIRANYIQIISPFRAGEGRGDRIGIC
jgi:hypothetical protein